MAKSDSIENLAKALVAAQGEFIAIPKTDSNPFFKSKYAGLPAVVEAASSILAKNGLAVSQFITASEEHQKQYLTTYLLHTSGEYIVHDMELMLSKQDAQGQGSAITYARRYSYMAVLGLVADDDDDGNAASPRTTPRPSVAVPSRSIGRPAMPVKQTVPPPALLFMPTDDGPYDSLPLAKPEATPAERIHPLTVTKLGSALQLKGITDQNMRKDILSSIARQEYMTTSFLELDEEQAQSILKRISLAKQEDLIALIDPFAPIG